jgi:hypothetical protein
MKSKRLEQMLVRSSIVLETVLKWKFGSAAEDSWFLKGTTTEPEKFLDKNIVLTSIQATKLGTENGRMEIRFRGFRCHYLRQAVPGLTKEFNKLGYKVRHGNHPSTYLAIINLTDTAGMDYPEFAELCMRIVLQIKAMFVWDTAYRSRRLYPPLIPIPTMVLVPQLLVKKPRARKPHLLELAKFLASKNDELARPIREDK